MLTEQRIFHNLEVISAFKNKTALADVLKNYTGWGGLRDEVYVPSVYQELKKSLSVEEITSLKQTLKSAYYTPAFLVQFIYDWLSIYGFKGGAILEPAVGHGAFIENMPKSIREQSTITTIEKDRLTSDIVQTLYPDLNHYTMGFEEYYTQDSFDLIVGNPPYGSQIVEDKHHADLQHHCIHHYFVAKCMRLLKEGGILAMVLPSFFLDNIRDHVRYIIHREGGSLLAAYRLPDDIFSGAKITIDIVFLTKGRAKNKWLKTRDITIGSMTKPINEYFHYNSHHLLGNLEIISIYERKGLVCKRRGDIHQLFAQALKDKVQTRLSKLSSSLLGIEQAMEELKAKKQQLLSSYEVMLGLARFL
ncbi:MAG: hypothetical protein BGO76_08505 [Caedibacter sp. 38-128]|nr:N-6 DNA methylase [Holosporales bacterium]OJX06510.1 MAG: hypothetical protein BGO76_08505 [Caedibacter sp. 38-128]